MKLIHSILGTVREMGLRRFLTLCSLPVLFWVSGFTSAFSDGVLTAHGVKLGLAHYLWTLAALVGVVLSYFIWYVAGRLSVRDEQLAGMEQAREKMERFQKVYQGEAPPTQADMEVLKWTSPGKPAPGDEDARRSAWVERDGDMLSFYVIVAPWREVPVNEWRELRANLSLPPDVRTYKTVIDRDREGTVTGVGITIFAPECMEGPRG